MGSLLSKFRGCFSFQTDPSRRILIMGTPHAGKSTVLQKLGFSIGGSRMSMSHAGVEVETVRLKGLEFVVLDVCGRDEDNFHYRPYYRNTRGIIFVADLASRSSLQDAARMLKEICEDDDLFGMPLLVFANKADIASPTTENDLVVELGLDRLHGQTHNVAICAATDVDYDSSFYEGLNWLAEQVEQEDELALRPPAITI